jgi:hypothetical protein
VGRAAVRLNVSLTIAASLNIDMSSRLAAREK